VHLAAFLPHPLLVHLRIVLGDAHALDSAPDLAQLDALLRVTTYDVLVVDPAIQHGQLADMIEELIARNRTLPVVAYTTLGPAAIRATMRLARIGVEHVVLNRFDDEPERFLALLERVPHHPMAEMVLKELTPQLRQLPVGVARALEQLLRSSQVVRNAEELAQLAGMAPRTMYRHLAGAGLLPRQLIVCARLIRAYTLLREPGSRLKEIAAKLGYADPDTLSHLLQEWTGRSAREIRRDVAPQEFVRLLGDYMSRAEQKAGEGDRAE
jgi:AraC-like DNA-binding protein